MPEKSQFKDRGFIIFTGIHVYMRSFFHILSLNRDLFISKGSASLTRVTK